LANQEVSSSPGRQREDRRIQHHRRILDASISRNDATVRFMDRFFDNYVMTPMQTLVSDRMRTQSDRDAKGVADASKMLDVAYGWLEERLIHQVWAAGGTFSLADCSAAPALFYADWVHPIGDHFQGVLAYRRRVLARPSVGRVVNEARPYRKLFPQGAPDRD
jgi:glutathione S-transferase